MIKNKFESERANYFQNWRIKILSFINGIGDLHVEEAGPAKAQLTSDRNADQDLKGAIEKFQSSVLDIINLKNSGDIYEARIKFIELDRVIDDVVLAQDRFDQKSQKRA